MISRLFLNSERTNWDSEKNLCSHILKVKPEMSFSLKTYRQFTRWIEQSVSGRRIFIVKSANFVSLHYRQSIILYINYSTVICFQITAVQKGAPLDHLAMVISKANRPYQNSSPTQVDGRFLLHTFGVAAAYAQDRYGVRRKKEKTL